MWVTVQNSSKTIVKKSILRPSQEKLLCHHLHLEMLVSLATDFAEHKT